MNLKSIIISLLLALTMTACMKDGDFDELRHPLVVEGDFDPVLGVPLAKASVNMIDIIDMLDTANNLLVHVNQEGLLTIRYQNQLHSTMVIDSKHSRPARKASSDTVFITKSIHGEVPISLFRKMRQITEDSVITSAILVSIDAMMRGYVSDSLQAAVDRGAKIYFDSLKLQVECMDGFVKTVPIHREILHVTIQELINGAQVKILNNYDFNDVVRHEPKVLKYNINMNMGVPLDQMAAVGTAFLDSLAVDSITAVMDARVDFPMQFYCHNLAFTDELPLDASGLDSLLNKVEEHVTLNDSASYLVFEASNEIPVSFGINATLLDANNGVVMQQLFNTDSILTGAPIGLKPGSHDVYVSAGQTKSRLVMPVDMAMLKNLSRTKTLRYRLVGSTSSLSKSQKSMVELSNAEKLNLRVYLVVSPHVHLDIPVEQVLNQ